MTAQLSKTDVDNMVALQTLMKGKKVSLFTDVDARSADELQQVFGIKSQDEIDEILEKTSRFQSAVSHLRDESSDTIAAFNEERQRSMEKAFKEHHNEIVNSKREIFDKSVEKGIEYVYKRKFADPVVDYQAHQFELDNYNDYMLNRNIDENDPIGLAADVHDMTLVELKEELLEAVNKRKQKVLSIAINIFNKV